VDDLSNLDRETLKAIAVANGLVEKGDRSRDETLRAKIREARAAGKVITAPSAGQAPPPPPPPPPSSAAHAAGSVGLTFRDHAILAAFSGLVAGNNPDDAATLAIGYGEALDKLRADPS
jgi:putative intracellular protease/amidase